MWCAALDVDVDVGIHVAQLQVDLSKRYGCLVSGVNDIKSHPWLRSIDWGALKTGKLEPPLK